MKFKIAHTNFNVMDLEKSVSFYKEALGLVELRRKEAGDGSFTLVFMGDEATNHQVELTYLRDREEPYDLSDNEIHLALVVDDFGLLMTTTRRWDAYVLKIKLWVSTLSKIRMGIG